MSFTKFNSVAKSPSSTFPTSLNVSLTSNEVVLDSTTGTVQALLFDSRTGVSASFESISGANGANTFTGRVDRAYHGATFAVYYSDRSSSLFTCNTAAVTQSLTANNYDAQGPEFLRLKNLGII